MILHQTLLASNPFFDAYSHADTLGKSIFIALFTLSALSWVIILYKTRINRKVEKLSKEFEKAFLGQKQNPLTVTYTSKTKPEVPHPFEDIYQTMRQQTVEILNKNHHFMQLDPNTPSFLSATDVEMVESHLNSTIASHTKRLEKHLYLLATTASLAPFLGLLGTVWGILNSFSEMQSQTGGNTSQLVLHGLSLALATTVLGLIDAIPALVGYNYLRSKLREYQVDMEAFAHKMLSVLELHYRKVE